ncbi:MAG: MFS transporter, partial [Dehalococcoidales bacterium]|nr:MFS transporter [Dehalococcoidales bacterium]
MLKHEALPLKKAKPKIFYGYVIVLSAFIIQAVGWGVPSTFGVFFKSLQDTFGWSRATIAGASSVSSLVVGVFSIGVGILTDRFGPRIIMTICGVLLGIGYLLMSQINTVWHLYLFYGLIIGIGSSATNVVLLATAARWFNKKRGMMSGIIKVGTGVGMLIMPIVAGRLIAIYDWRLSYTIVAIIAIIFILPLAQLLKRDPAQMGQLPDGVVQTNTNNTTRVAETGFSPRELFHTRQFWLMCVIFLTITFCTQPILVHIVRHSEDLGAATASAAGVLSTIGGVSILGRLAMGYASDRIGN